MFFADTAARIRRSLPPIYRTVYGSDEDNAGAMVRTFHTTIKGEMPEEFSGGRYHALDPATYHWAHATFDQVLYFTDTFVRGCPRRKGADVRRVQDLVPALWRQRQADARRLRRF